MLRRSTCRVPTSGLISIAVGASSSTIISSPRFQSSTGQQQKQSKFTGSAWQGNSTNNTNNNSSSTGNSQNQQQTSAGGDGGAGGTGGGRGYDDHTRYLMFRNALNKLFRGLLYSALISEFAYPTVLPK